MKKLIFYFILLLSILSNSYSQHLWHQVNGPNGAVVLCIAVNSEGDIFEGNELSPGAVAKGGGLYKLMYGDSTWSQSLENTLVPVIFIRDSEMIITQSNQFMHSFDKGNTWSIMGSITPSYFPINVIHYDWRHNIFYVNVNSYVYYSVDNLQTFTTTTMPSNNDIVTDTNGTVFSCTCCGSGIYRSFDSGGTYTPVFPGPQYFSRLGVNSHNEIFAGAYTNGSGLFKSLDGGDHWIEIDSGFSNKDVIDMVIDSNDDIFVITGDGIVHISNDDGYHWIHLASGIIKPNAIYHDEINHKIIIGSYRDGIHMADDLNPVWHFTSDSINNSFIYTINRNHNGDMYCGTNVTVFKSTDNGESWHKSNFTTLPGKEIWNIEFNSQGYIFMTVSYTGTGTAGLFRSTDNGNSWQQIDTACNHVQMMGLAINSNDNIFVSDIHHGIRKSLDNGNTWQQLDTAIIGKFLDNIFITRQNNILVSTRNPSDTVYRSTDNGNIWLQTNYYGNEIAKFVQLSDSTIIASTNTKMYASFDDGINWVKTYDNGDWYEDISAGQSNALYGLTRDVLMVSYDYGATWTGVSNPLNDYNPVKLFISPGNQFYLGTLGNGIYKTDSIPVLSIANIKPENLFTLYPNPSTGIIHLSFAEPAKDTRIEVMNSCGQLVSIKTINHQTQTTLDLTTQAKGMYFIKVQSGSGVVVGKVVISE